MPFPSTEGSSTPASSPVALVWRLALGASGVLLAVRVCLAAAPDPGALVDPIIGSANRGNTFPGAVVPFGMVQFSPETSRDDATRRAAPGGYAHDAPKVRGFSLTHLSGTGCRGASGDIPFLPFVGPIDSSPSTDKTDSKYVGRFSHVNETASPGYYRVRFSSGVTSELTASARTAQARFSFPAHRPAAVLVRASDSEVGSSDAQLAVDTAARTVSGSVTSGNFCGYLGTVDRRSYYTLHFVAVFDQPFAAVGAWEDAALKPGATGARGGTGYGTAGTPPPGKGSGLYLQFDSSRGATVGLRVGISYVSLANAQANLRAEAGPAVTFEASRERARQAWNQELGRIQLGGGTPEQLTVFYTALYHSLLHPNLFSDSNGEYAGFDGRTHQLAAPQRAQYANFSGWDVYRSQLQLVTWLNPDRGSDIAQSLLNQADQNQGVWDRWTHNAGATAVMTGDPAAIAVASIFAFGGTRFDVKAALASLVKAATAPTRLDLSKEGCPVACRGQRPSLDRWLSIHYIPAVSNSWGGAGETLEAASADFAVSQLALRLGEESTHQKFLARAQYWQNVFNPRATPAGGYIQNRNQDGSWPPFDPADDDGFAEGSSAQYSWMVPFNLRGLIDLMGGNQKVNDRLDAFFHHPDGGWAITGSGGLYAELDNEPSIGAPWVYLHTGRPGEAQRVVRQAVNTLWSHSPHGIPGNDDLGAMSSWYVFATLGLYPAFPGRAELLIGSPLFRSARLQRATGKVVTIRAPRAAASVPFVQGLRVNGRASNRSWLPESFIAEGGDLDFQLAAAPSRTWATSATDAPPSFGSDER